MKFRHELKFLVSDQEIAILKNRFMHVLQSDFHQKEDYYVITSLYFDDDNDSCLRENKYGVDNRCKYRLRLYNHSTDVIKLEKKLKQEGRHENRRAFFQEKNAKC